MNFSDELKIGAMTVVALTIGFLGFYYLKGVPLFTKTDKIYVVLDNAASVSPASPVSMYGIKIGKVQTVSQEKKVIGTDTFNVVFFLNLDRGSKVPKGSTVEIVELDLLGNKELRIAPSHSSGYLTTGDTIVGSVKGGMMAMLQEELDETLGPLVDQTVPLVETIDTLISNVTEVLMGNEEGNLDGMMVSLSKSLKNIERITAKVNSIVDTQSESIEGILSNADKITSALASNTEDIDSILANVNTLTGKLSQADFDKIIASATESIAKVETLMSEITEGDGTIHKLIFEDGLYNGIDSTLIAATALLEDLKANPKRYVSFALFGGRDKSNKED